MGLLGMLRDSSGITTSWRVRKSDLVLMGVEKMSGEEFQKGGANKTAYERIKQGLEEAIQYEQGRGGAVVTLAAIAEGRALAYDKAAIGFSTISDLRVALETDKEEE